MERLADGSARLTFGNNLDAIPLSHDATHFAEGEGSSPPVTAAVLDWSCQVYTLWPIERLGSYLHAEYEIDCHNVIAHRDGRQIERDSWSGWRPYTNFAWRAWRYTVNIQSSFYALCDGGGTYNYRLRVVSQVQLSYGTVQSPSWYNGSSRHSCGTGVS